MLAGLALYVRLTNAPKNTPQQIPKLGKLPQYEITSPTMSTNAGTNARHPGQ